MNHLFQVGRSLLLIILLTFFTQVGGVVYLFYQPLGQRIRKRSVNAWSGRVRRWAVFSTLYLTVSLLLVPPLARPFGRVPLPWRATEEAPLRPVNLLTCLTNRHYVDPALRNLLVDVARKTNRDAERTLLYLDANFPFLEGFPLLPHRSHDDHIHIQL